MSRLMDQFDFAKQYLAGGVSASTRVNKALGRPMYFDRAKGCRLWDLDGKEYIDLCCSHGATLLGHGDEGVRAAVEAVLARGAACSYENELHALLAKALCETIPCMERVRFTGSGSEATMHCIRLARSFTARNKLLKFEGNFHGYHDQVMYAIGTPAEKLGPETAPTAFPGSTGMPEGLDRQLVIVPYNRTDLFEEAFGKHAGELAAVVMEPVYYNAGCIIPSRDFMQTVRQRTREAGVLLMFDEVLSAFRMGPGGAQEYLGITPDLCTLGKAVGGGYPLSVFGGRADIMKKLMPDGDCQHSGTYNGHVVCVAAGLAAVNAYRSPRFYDHINLIAAKLYSGLNAIFARYGVAARVQGLGARFGVYFGDVGELRNYRDAVRHQRDRMLRFIAAAIDNGVYFHDYGGAACHHGFCAATSLADVDEALQRLDQAVRDMAEWFMRIAIGQLWQETNTFNPIPTTRADFEEFGIVRGRELVETMAETNELGGFIQSLRAWPERPEIVGLVRLPAWPSGTATAETFASLRDELIGALRAAQPVDAVLLALHGSMVAVDAPDVEGEILAACREVVGASIPIVATLDLHANVTEHMIQSSDALVIYHTAPHIDVFETGQRGAQVLRRILDGARPVRAFRKLPMVVPAERANTQEPNSISYRIREMLQECERNPRILSAGLATVQPWLDIPELGSAVVVVADNDEKLAECKCHEIAAFVWEHRRDYLPQLVSIEHGVRAAYQEKDGLVVLSDSADATTSGAPGDSNHLLREMLKYEWPRPAVVTLVDADLVAEAQTRGVGVAFEALLGGKRDFKNSSPLAVEVTVAGLFEARFVMSGHLAKNMPIDMGPSAVLRIDNIHVIVTSRSGPHFAPQLFEAAGIDPFACQLLVAKSPCGFRAAYAERARQIHVVRAPGCAPSDFWNYEYRRMPRPLWPWDNPEMSLDQE